MQEEFFSSDSKNDNKNKNSEPSSASNTLSILAITLLNKITSIGTNPNDFVK